VRWMLCLLCACGPCGPQAAPVAEAPTIERTPGEAPADLTGTVCVDGGDATLSALREALAGDLFLELVPESLGELVERFVAVDGQVIRHVATTGSVCAISLGESDAQRTVVVAPLSLEPGPSPLGAGITPEDGAPRGARWVQRGEVVAALAGDLLIAAEDEEALERGIGYAAFAVHPQERPEGVTMRFEPGFLSGLRGLADMSLQAQVRDARSAIEVESAAHEDPPAYGDPSALVRFGSDEARGYVAMLPDVGALDLHAHATPAGLRATAELEVRPGTPLAERLDALPAGTPPFAGLPEGTALAWYRAGYAEDERGLLAALAAAAGDRMPEELVASIADGFGDGTRTWALGTHDVGPWLRIESDAPAAEELQAFLGSDYIAGLAEVALGCTPSGLRCGERAVLLGDGLLYADAEHPLAAWRFANAPRAGSVRGDADAARLLGDLPADVFAALWLEPGAVPAAATLTVLPFAGREPSPPAPAMALFRRTEDAMVVELRFTPRAPSQLLTFSEAVVD